MTDRPRETQAGDFLSRLSSYATAAGVGVFACGQDAEAGLVYVDTPDQSTSVGDPSLEIDLNGDSTVDLTLFVENSFGTNTNGRFVPYNNPTGTNFLSTFQSTPTNGGYYIQSFAPGALIDGSAFQSSAYGVSGGRRSGIYAYNFVGEGNYVGFQWEFDGELFFGWLEADFTVDPAGGSDPGTITLKSFAYSTVPGAGVVAGDISAIPEPSTLGILALGGGALALANRRRRAS